VSQPEGDHRAINAMLKELHRCGMAKQLLHGANIRAVFEQVRRETVTIMPLSA